MYCLDTSAFDYFLIIGAIFKITSDVFSRSMSLIWMFLLSLLNFVSGIMLGFISLDTPCQMLLYIHGFHLLSLLTYLTEITSFKWSKAIPMLHRRPTTKLGYPIKHGSISSPKNSIFMTLRELQIVYSVRWSYCFFYSTYVMPFLLINPFVPNAPFFYHLKTSKNLRFSDVFTG